MKTIQIYIKSDGEIEIEAVGFRGADCEKATAFLEQVLGRARLKVRRPEYYQRVRSSVQQKVGQ